MQKEQQAYLDSLINDFDGLEDTELAYLIDGLTELRAKKALETDEDRAEEQQEYNITTAYSAYQRLVKCNEMYARVKLGSMSLKEFGSYYSEHGDDRHTKLEESAWNKHESWMKDSSYFK